jgi:predicted secreted hydrolase
MVFRLRSEKPNEDYLSGTWITPGGTPTPLAPDALTIEPSVGEPSEGRQVPIEWRVRVPELGVDVTTQVLNPNSWMKTLFPYWEGPISFEGSHSGRGYLEMTGYE